MASSSSTNSSLIFGSIEFKDLPQEIFSSSFPSLSDLHGGSSLKDLSKSFTFTSSQSSIPNLTSLSPAQVALPEDLPKINPPNDTIEQFKVPLLPVVPQHVVSGAIVPVEQIAQRNEAMGRRYVDITHLLAVPQKEAANRLAIPSSTLSKRWREATIKRKWPQKVIQRIDKEIEAILRNVPHNSSQPLSQDVEKTLAQLLKKRQEELRPVVIRL